MKESTTTTIRQWLQRGLLFPFKLLVKVKHMVYTSQAKSLNQQLFQDTRSISNEDMDNFENRLHQFSKDRLYGADYEEEFVAQRYRLYLSLKWIEEALKECGYDLSASSLNGLEMGGITIVTDLLAQTFPQVNWQNTTGDIRYSWENAGASADLIVSMEVLEHLSDLPDGINNGFFGTGLRAALRESYRVLKPGGILFITTPNAASAFNLTKSIGGFPARYYLPHVREYTLEELKTILQEVGFKIHRAKAVQCLTVEQNPDYTFLFRLLLDSPAHANISDRGDDLFIIAIK